MTCVYDRFFGLGPFTEVCLICPLDEVCPRSLLLPPCQEEMTTTKERVLASQAWRRVVRSEADTAEFERTKAALAVGGRRTKRKALGAGQALPLELKLVDISAFLQTGAGCYAFIDKKYSRARVFYPSPNGMRSSSSARFEKFGGGSSSQACHCLGLAATHKGYRRGMPVCHCLRLSYWAICQALGKCDCGQVRLGFCVLCWYSGQKEKTVSSVI